jgi:hypothetical protein
MKGKQNLHLLFIMILISCLNSNGNGIGLDSSTSNKIKNHENSVNKIEILQGATLTRKEMDLIEDPNVLENLKNIASQDKMIIIQDGNTTIKLSYIQVVTYNSDCYKELLKMKKPKSLNVI